MLEFIEWLKVVFLGIVEMELSNGFLSAVQVNMLLVAEFIKLNVSDAFKEVFCSYSVGSNFSGCSNFWNKMWPFQMPKESQSIIKKDRFSLWFKVVVSCIPGAVVTLLFDDYVEAHFHTPVVIAIALIFYGIAFIIIENKNKNKVARINTLEEISYKDAFLIGVFQVLSIVPGTSRSGSTIIGGLLMGISRVAIAEFTFFMAVPVMFGLSAIKIIKFGFNFTHTELAILIWGMVIAFAVSIIVIKFLMSYIKKHDFKVFGWYRIILGIIVLAYFL